MTVPTKTEHLKTRVFVSSHLRSYASRNFGGQLTTSIGGTKFCLRADYTIKTIPNWKPTYLAANICLVPKLLAWFLVQRIRQSLAQVILHKTAFRRLFAYFTKIIRTVNCSYHCKMLSYLDRDGIYKNTVRATGKWILQIRFGVLSFLFAYSLFRALWFS